MQRISAKHRSAKCSENRRLCFRRSEVAAPLSGSRTMGRLRIYRNSPENGPKGCWRLGGGIFPPTRNFRRKWRVRPRYYISARETADSSRGEPFNPGWTLFGYFGLWVRFLRLVLVLRRWRVSWWVGLREGRDMFCWRRVRAFNFLIILLFILWGEKHLWRSDC